MKGLIIGCGSAGRNYIRSALGLNHFITIFDNDPLKISELQSTFEGISVLKNLEDISTNYDYIVIATTAESHLDICSKMIAQKPRVLVVEKLLSNNLSHLDKLALLKSNNKEICFTTHNRWKLLGVTNAIEGLRNKFTLGDFTFFQSLGGAMCVASGSVHWLASFYNLFGLKVNSFKLSGHLVPRPQINRPHLDSMQGNFQLDFAHASIKFDYLKRSKVTPIQIFLFENGIISLNFSGDYEVFRSDLEQIGYQQTYGLATLRESGNLIEVGANPFSNLLESIELGTQSSVDFEHALYANEIVLLSLQLSDNSTLTDRDLKLTRLNGNLYDKAWRIT